MTQLEGEPGAHIDAGVVYVVQRKGPTYSRVRTATENAQSEADPSVQEAHLVWSAWLPNDRTDGAAEWHLIHFKRCPTPGPDALSGPLPAQAVPAGLRAIIKNTFVEVVPAAPPAVFGISRSYSFPDLQR